MILPLMILIPFAGAILAGAVGRKNPLWSRVISLLALGLGLGAAFSLWSRALWSPAMNMSGLGEDYLWIAEFNHEWIPELGISLHLAIDGLSLLLVLLTFLLGIVAVVCSWTEIQKGTGFFHLNLMLTITGVLGVFLSLDLFLFYFFWELMLVPMYFLISVWGHEGRGYASVKFFIFTQLSGLLMLLGILGLYFIHGRATGTYTFDYTRLIGTTLGPREGFWIMLGFFAAFAVKLPVIPFHTWLADAHTEAPTAGSVLLAGLLLKTGAYGLFRFLLPLFPEAVEGFRIAGMALGVAGIIYGALLAYAQTDLKRLIACSSISHMGFVLLGIFSMNQLGLQGAVIQMLCHGFSTGGLFIIAGALQERLHTRDLAAMGGIWPLAPRMAGAGLFFALAALALPGLGNFIGEFLVLLGAYQVNGSLTAIAAAGMALSAVYSLRIVQSIFHGRRSESLQVTDLSPREMTVMACMAAVIIFLGLFPQPVLDISDPALKRIIPSMRNDKTVQSVNIDGFVKSRHSREGGNPDARNVLKRMDSRLRPSGMTATERTFYDGVKIDMTQVHINPAGPARERTE
ncbi:MAG: NADH-quinone oxidoreductase subunit M [Thermodesulfovibrionales bacterium]